MNEKTLRKRLAAAARRAAAHGLVRCSSGNISCRINDDFFLVSASGSWLERLEPEDLILCRTDTGRPEVKGAIPSIETGLHQRVLLNRRDIKAVFHFQSEAGTLFSCTSRSLPDFNIIPEIPYYIGKVRTVPYLPPGSAELAEAVSSAMEGCNLVILKNHGQVTVGTDPEDALQRAVFFEFACRLILLSSHASYPLRSLHDLQSSRYIQPDEPCGKQ